MEEVLNMFIAFIGGVILTFIVFANISTYNGKLTDRGFAEYNSTTGKFQLKDNK